MAIGLTWLGVPVVEQLLLTAAMTIVSAYLGRLLFKAETDAKTLAAAE
jgi:hypothetical protein